MADIEKVIKGLENCSTTDGNCQWAEHPDCPYLEDCKAEKYSALDRDALALLKEQETKLICNLLGGQPYEVYCRECRTVLCILDKGETINDAKSIFSYCPHCGRSVKWE